MLGTALARSGGVSKLEQLREPAVQRGEPLQVPGGQGGIGCGGEQRLEALLRRGVGLEPLRGPAGEVRSAVRVRRDEVEGVARPRGPAERVALEAPERGRGESEGAAWIGQLGAQTGRQAVERLD